MAKVNNPVMLIVLDGWGHSDDSRHNAILSANTPVWDELWSSCPHALISCSGSDVGLPQEQMGNSEVGHMHMGAGRRIDQDFSRINKAIENGEFEHNRVFLDACARAVATDANVHIMGLLSPGGVHSHENHIIALIELAHAQGAQQILVHAFLDGRDTPPQSAADSLRLLNQHCQALGNAHIASIQGRYYAMDRNQNWERTALAYGLIVDGLAEHSATDPLAALEQAYARGENDEFVAATVIVDATYGRHIVADGDVIIFANFRSDRARQITAALSATDFIEFERVRAPQLGAFVTMTDYGEQFSLPIAYPSFNLPNNLGTVIASRGLRQLRIAETEKYAHVTFFFNGGEERVCAGEDRILVPSPKVATYDLCPEMSANEVTKRLCEAVASGDYDTIICNFANADMVGHTGNFDATVKCIETLDACLGRIVSVARAHATETLITADHGNAEKMRAPTPQNPQGDPHTAHTSNLVPVIYIGRPARIASTGTLADIAPTLLALMALDIPTEMTGKSLLTIDSSAQDAA
jgi:2,3-bisphosphoglycerate-independent phosphoglycerate mutase